MASSSSSWIIPAGKAKKRAETLEEILNLNNVDTEGDGLRKRRKKVTVSKKPEESSTKSLRTRTVKPKSVDKFKYKIPAAFSEECQVKASQLSTYELLQDPNLLKSGFNLLSQLEAKEMNAKQVGKRIGLFDSPPAKTDRVLRGRKAKTEVSSTMSSSSESGTPSPTSSPEKSRSINDSPGKNEDFLVRREKIIKDKHSTHQGEIYVRELLRRTKNTNPRPIDADPEALNEILIPGYKAKKMLRDEHCQKIRELSFEDLVLNYESILHELRLTFTKGSPRTDLFIQGDCMRSRLKDMAVSLPFSSEQSTGLITKLFDYFVPDMSQRPVYADYITLVLLPEALIRIFARVNQVSYAFAEKELRFGVYYEDDPEPEEPKVVPDPEPEVIVKKSKRSKRQKT